MNKIIGIISTIIIMLNISACSDVSTTIGSDSTINDSDEVSLTYTADFYDNSGGKWLSVNGKTFAINPNRVKTYSWDSDGSWISSYEMSSIMSIDIDGLSIESCGSTVLFADSRLQQCDIDFGNAINTTASANKRQDSSITQPKDIRMEDWARIHFWWSQKSLNSEPGSKLVIIQSQLGNPICMYIGKTVKWDIPKNLPKTTMITIDGMALYIHRANFAVIDTKLLNENCNVSGVYGITYHGQQDRCCYRSQIGYRTA